MAYALDSARVASAVALLRVLSPMTPNDGQVQHAATLGHEQGQQPVGEVVDVGGFRKRDFHGRPTHHDQTMHVAGAVGVLPAAARPDGAPRCRDQFSSVNASSVPGHHGLRAGIQRIGQLREGVGFVQIVGIDKGHQRQIALRVTGSALRQYGPDAGQNVQLDRCVALRLAEDGPRAIRRARSG